MAPPYPRRAATSVKYAAPLKRHLCLQMETMSDGPVTTLPNNSFYTLRLPEGCAYCQEGAKMVLLVTGQCPTGCFYCPLSETKRGRAVVYANEKLATSDEDVIGEATAMAAEGTGITGGEPLAAVERTLHFIGLLKDVFGSRHHIHLYTSVLEPDRVERVIAAGVDEVRFHPPVVLWTRIDSTPLAAIAARAGVPVGLEIPALPHLREETRGLLEWVAATDLSFANINELEFSATNGDRLRRYGYRLKNDVSNAAAGSESLAYEVLEWDLSIPVHYCSSSFKDAVQLRKRLLRRACTTAPLYAQITEDGTLLKGVIECPREALPGIRSRLGVSSALMQWDEERRRVETSPEIAQAAAEVVPHPCFIVEEYPTADRLEVEREPL